MGALPLPHRLRSLWGAISQWWCNRFETKSRRSEQECFGASEVARELGPSASGLLTLSSHEPDVDTSVGAEGDLLRRRMEALHLDPNELAQSDPFLLSELQRLCAMCKNRGACALELEHVSADVAWGEWREYCPNAVTLNELRIRARMRSSPTAFK
jgi:hypothetical protein